MTADAAPVGRVDAERSFFRAVFRDRTLVVALRPNTATSDSAVARTAATIRDLLDGAGRVLICASRCEGPVAGSFAAEFRVPVRAVPGSSTSMAEMWIELEDRRVVVVEVDDDPAPVAAELAARLGVSKLVLTDPLGGWGTSFGSEADLAAGHLPRPVVADAIRRALAGGVDGVNLCRTEELDTELFTFDGAGTLFTRHGYVHIEPLSADDLPVVEGLVERGVAEGYLRPRTRAEVVRLALDGLGARVSPSGHLAGIGTLETERYRSAGLAEVVCLYTITRFAGEGVGGDLLGGLVAQARRDGNDAVFACTVSDRAAGLFLRSGFEQVPLDRLPTAKWDDYDPDRRRRLRALWFDLVP